MRTLQPPDEVIARYLKPLPLFEGFGGAELLRLASQTFLRTYDKGDWLFFAETPADELLCLLRGSVRICRPLPDGREKVLHLLSGPCLLAEAPTLLGESFPAGAQAGDECLVAAVPRSALLRAAETQPNLPWRIIAALFRRLQELTQSLAGHAQKSASTRVASYLLGLAAGSPDLALPAAKKDVANYLGLRAESFSRALATLQKSGAIEVADEQIRITDLAALEAELAE